MMFPEGLTMGNPFSAVTYRFDRVAVTSGSALVNVINSTANYNTDAGYEVYTDLKW
jgi:hypothetical protein